MKKAGLLFLLITLGHTIFAQAAQKPNSKSPAPVSAIGQDKPIGSGGSTMSSHKASPTQGDSTEINYQSGSGAPSSRKASSIQATQTAKPISKGPPSSRKAADQ